MGRDTESDQRVAPIPVAKPGPHASVACANQNVANSSTGKWKYPLSTDEADMEEAARKRLGWRSRGNLMQLSPIDMEIVIGLLSDKHQPDAANPHRLQSVFSLTHYKN